MRVVRVIGAGQPFALMVRSIMPTAAVAPPLLGLYTTPTRRISPVGIVRQIPSGATIFCACERARATSAAVVAAKADAPISLEREMGIL